MTIRSTGHHWRQIISGALLLVLALPLAAQKNFNQEEKEIVEKSKRARPHLLKGASLLEKGNLEKARKEIDACLGIFPEFADANLLLAQVEYLEGAFEPALKEVEAAKLYYARFSKFLTYSHQNYLDRLRADRDNQENLINQLERAVINASADQKRLLMVEITRARQALTTIDSRLHDPIPPVMEIPAEYHFIHGNILFKMKRLDEARGLYESAVLADPRHANAHNNLIGICLARGDRAGALKHLEQAEKNGVTVNEKLKQAVLSGQPPR